MGKAKVPNTLRDFIDNLEEFKKELAEYCHTTDLPLTFKVGDFEFESLNQSGRVTLNNATHDNIEFAVKIMRRLENAVKKGNIKRC